MSLAASAVAKHCPKSNALFLVEKLLRIFGDESIVRGIRLRRSVESDGENVPMIATLVNIINTAYHRGEQGMWCDLDGWARTDTAEVVRGLKGRRFIIAFNNQSESEVVGCIRIDPLFDTESSIGEFGMLAVSEKWLGLRIGSKLIQFAERTLKECKCEISCLELLRPNKWTHPENVKLDGWYRRIGYRQVSTMNLAELNPHLTHLLATECTLHVYHKKLS